MGKQLVIDASVARAAGGTSSCKNFLKEVRRRNYHIIMSPYIKEEWEHQESRFSVIWRGQMLSEGKLRITPIEIKIELRSDIERVAPSQECKETMLKDTPLIEAALETDKIIISLDERVRKLFAHVSKHIYVIKIVIWVNPDRESEEPIHWLRRGAEMDTERQLGHLFDERRHKSDSNKCLMGFEILSEVPFNEFFGYTESSS